MSNYPHDDDEYRKKIKELEKYIPILESLMKKYKDNPQDVTTYKKLEYFYDLLIKSSKGPTPKISEKSTLNRLQLVLEALAQHNSESTTSTTQRNSQAQNQNVSNDCQPSTSRQGNLSSRVPIIDLDDDVVEVGESSVHRNTLETTVSDNEIEILEVEVSQLGRSRVSSRRSRTQYDDDDCWEIPQYEPLPPEENETWLRCDDDGEIIDEIPTFSRTDVQTSTNDENGQNKMDKSNRYDRGRSRNHDDRFYVRCRSISRERPDQRDTYERSDKHSRHDEHERSGKHKHKHKKKHKRSDKDSHSNKHDRPDKYDRYDRPERLDRPNRLDEVSDRTKHSKPPSSLVPSTVTLNHLEGSRRNREPESAIAQNPGSRLVPVDSADFQKMVAEAIEKIAKKKVSEETSASSSVQKQELDKPNHPNESQVSISPGMICEISTTPQGKEASPRVPVHPGVDHTPTNHDFGSPIELQNQIGFNSRPPNNGPCPYPMTPSAMNLWNRNPGPGVVMPQLSGSFPLQPQPVPPPFPMMQPFTIGSMPPSQLNQPLAPFPALPNHPPTDLPRHWDPNVNRPRTEVQGPKPGTSSSNLRPGAPSFTRAPLTYGEYKARQQSSFARDPRKPRGPDRSAPLPSSNDRSAPLPASNDCSAPLPASNDRSAPISTPFPTTNDRMAPLSTPFPLSNTPVKDSRSACDKDPRNLTGKARIGGTSELNSVSKPSQQIPTAKPQKEKSKDLRVQNPKMKPPKGPPPKPAESHKSKSGSKDHSSDKKRSKSSSQDEKKRTDTKNAPGEKKKPLVEVYQSPLESLYGVVNAARTGPGYGLQKFKIPKIKRKPQSQRVLTPSPPPTQEEEEKIEEDIPIPDVPQANNDNWYDDDPLPDTFTLDNTDVSMVQEKITETKSLEDIEDTVDLTEVEALASVRKDEDESVEVRDFTTIGSSVSTKEDKIQSLDVRDILQKLKNNDLTLEDAEAKFLERLKIKAKTKKSGNSSDSNESSDSEQERSKKSLRKEKKKKRLVKRNFIESDSSDDDYFSKRQDENRLRETEKPKTDDDEMNDSRVPNIVEVDQNQSNEMESENKSKENVQDGRRAGTANVKQTEKKKRRKNDLEKLHDDIKEMFIGGEVLSLLDQPTCRTKYDPPKSTAISSDDSDVPFENTKKHKSKTRAGNRSKSSEFSNNSNSSRATYEKVTLERVHTSNTNQSANTSSDDSSDDRASTPSLSHRNRKDVNDGMSNDNSKKKKKKRSSWQNGVLPRLSKKRTNKTADNGAELQEEIGKTQTITIKQLLDYIWVDQQKTKCLCCNYVGKNIVHHYSVQHPNEEVMISRLSMDQAEKAIYQTLQCEMNPEETVDVIMTYTCRFCTYSKTSAVPAMALLEFYEHCSTHTGEYLYRCSFCPYRALTEGTVKTHFYKICKHKTKSNVNDAVIEEKIPSKGNCLIGHICSKCNFIQMKRSTVEAHVKRWHKDSDVKVIEINMSDYIKVEEERSCQSDEEINSVNNIIDMVIKNESFNIDEDAERQQLAPLVEDVITEKEIVCPNVSSHNIKAEDEDMIAGQQMETTEETDPLDGVGGVVKTECCDQDINVATVTLASEQPDANDNPSSAEEYYDQDVTTENFVKSEQPDERVVLDFSDDFGTVKIENVATLQDILQTDEFEEPLDTKCFGVSMPPRLEEPITSSISAPVPPKFVKSANPVSKEPTKLNPTILTPPPTPMPVFQNLHAANHPVPYQMHPNVNFALETSTPSPAMNTTISAVAPVLQTANNTNQISTNSKPRTTMRAIDRLLLKNFQNISGMSLRLNMSQNNHEGIGNQEPTRATDEDEEFISTNLLDDSHMLEAANSFFCREMACTSVKDSRNFEFDLKQIMGVKETSQDVPCQRPIKRKSDEDPNSGGLRHKLFRTLDFQGSSKEDKMNSRPG